MWNQCPTQSPLEKTGSILGASLGAQTVKESTCNAGDLGSIPGSGRETCRQDKKQQLELDMEQWTWFKIGKGVHRGCLLLPYLFNLYAEYIMWNARLDESQTGIKITGRNINSLTYADVNTLMAESKEELKSLLMRVKEQSKKDGLRLNIQKTKIRKSNPITSWQIDREKVKTLTDFSFEGSKITVDIDCSHEII